ncbi:MAG: bifunctional diguanylate cyclase/phosphodiesterase [Paucibacter sp.]|nr:bifunctional diguanylate cyclase/phosphodiesterase [Roseateles sp.]
MWSASDSFTDSWQRLRTSQALLLGTALLALVALPLWSILNDRSVALQVEQENTLRLAESLRAHVGALLEQSEFSLRGVEADLVGTYAPGRSQQIRALRQAMRYDSLSSALGVLSDDGLVMVASDGAEITDAELERRVRASPEQPFQFLPALRSANCRDWCLPLIMQGQGRRVVALVAVRALLGTQDSVRMVAGAYVGFATPSGQRLFQYDAGRREISCDARPVNERFLQGERGTFEAAARLSGEPTLFGYSRALGQPFIAAVGVPRRMVDDAWRARAAAPLALLLVATASIAFLGLRLLRARRAERAYMRRQQYLSSHDDVTGLLNRSTFERALQRSVQGERLGRFAVLLIGINQFNEITGTLGHRVGDAAIAAVAERLQAHFDAKRCTLARVGGSEFAVSLPLGDGMEEVEQACLVAREALASAIVVDGIALQLSASTGVALHPEDGTDSRELLRLADIAMHAARRTRLQQLRYAPSQERFSTQLLALKVDLAQALRHEGLSLVYQPKVELATGQLCGVEALARWQHPQHGFVSPAEFVPLAETCELVHPFTEQVLCLALRQCAQWLAAGWRVPVAVNVSVNNLMNAAFVTRTQELLQLHGVAPELLEMEVTEGALMRNPETALARLSELRALGVRLSIDDFGSGYASLGYLKKLPVDVLKIDKSFTTDLIGDAANRLIVRWTIGLAQGLGLKVVAEGVESAEVAELLRRKNCDIGQGYHFGRPMQAGALEHQWLLSRSISSVAIGQSP